MKPSLLLPPALIVSAFSCSLHAATLLPSFSAAPNNLSTNPYTFPTGPDTDWAYWTRGSGTAAGPLNANNSSSTGTRTFSIAVLNGTLLRGPTATDTGAPLSYFDYNNGESPTAPDSAIITTSKPTGLFNSLLGPNGVPNTSTGFEGAGIQTTLTGFTTQSLISVWVYNFSSQGTFEVYINNVLSYTEVVAIPTNPTGGKAAYLFSLNFTPDSAADSVNIRYRMTDRLSTDGSAHVGMQAIAISPIPEPASLALLALGAATTGLRRRRR